MRDSGIMDEDDIIGLPRLSQMSGNKQKDWKGWLKDGSFYVHGVVYMMVRIAVNVTMVIYFYSHKHAFKQI